MNPARHVLFAMDAAHWRRMFAGATPPFDPRVDVLEERPLSDFFDERHTADLARVDTLITGWGCPPITRAALDRMPRLSHIVHSAGSVKGHLTDAVWERGIAVSSARLANSLPVAEYTVAAILLANKRVFQLASRLATERTAIVSDDLYPSMGNYRKRVGVIGASTIGRRVIELLAPFSFEIVVYDPHLGADEARRLGVERLTLMDLAQTSDVVSIHAPELESTKNLIDAAFIDRMKADAVLINTARGSLVDHQALRRRLRTGQLFAILDVTEPWVLPAGDELYELGNVVLTPHLAGSMGVELQRLAEVAVGEVNRLAAGLAFEHPVVQEGLTISA